jgi:hypothetical protein
LNRLIGRELALTHLVKELADGFSVHRQQLG